MPAVVKFLREKRWALVAIFLGVFAGFGSALICIAWNLVIFGFNIMYIVSPLLGGFIETFIASRKYGRSTGAISALLTFMIINGYGWFGPGIIFPKEPVTLSLITIIAIILTIQAAFPILVNYILFVVVVGTFLKITKALLNLPSRLIQRMPIETEKKIITKQPDEIFLDELTTPLLSVPHVNGKKIQSYVGLVAGEGIAEEKKSEGRFSNLLKIIEPTPLEDMNLGEAKKVALSRMLENAASMGANAVEEVLIDYVSMGGLQGSVTIVTATGTAVILGEVSEESSVIGMIEKIRVLNSDESISGTDENISVESSPDDLSTGAEQFQNEPKRIIPELEFTTSTDLKELEKRYLNVSRDLAKLDNRFEEKTRYEHKIKDNVKLVNKSDYRGMNVMRIKEEIIGKEVVDVNATVIGNVKDVDITFETRTVEALIVGKGGILGGLRSSEDIIVPLDMVVAIKDKILIKREY
jgi:sporulation protein YlmC with PRC-barrel domain/uncharacterized protein YbjQ (UPF0145 family)